MNKFLFPTFTLTCLLALLLCTITDSANAQTKEDLLRVYDSATIHSIGRFYIKGNNRVRFGELKREFTSPISRTYYRGARADRAWGTVFAVSAAGALVTGILVRKNNTTWQYTIRSRHCIEFRQPSFYQKIKGTYRSRHLAQEPGNTFWSTVSNGPQPIIRPAVFSTIQMHQKKSFKKTA